MKTYGPWQYNEENLTLTHENGYEIDVETWTTSAQVLDWIFQIYKKSWKDEKTMPSLLLAIEEIINPQQHLCSFGTELGPINVRELAN